MSSRTIGPLLLPAGLALLTVALILGATYGMDDTDWALVILASFTAFLNSVLAFERVRSRR